MATYQVDCHVPDGADADQRIDALGGPGGGGWQLPIDSIIAIIESNEHNFFTRVNNQSVWIIVARRSNGRKYLKTEADGYEPNNLLSLPDCRYHRR